MLDTQLSNLFSSSTRKLPKAKGRPTKGKELMAVNLRDFESILISKPSALVFAVLGLGIGSVAFFKYKAPPPEVVNTVVKDTRDPNEVALEKNIEKASQLLSRQLYKSAQEILVNAYKQVPKNTFVLSMLAMTERKNGDLTNAEIHLNEAIALEPGQWVFYNNLGNILFDKGRPADAIKSYERALELSPKNHVPLLGKAKVLELIGKFTEARLSYGKALEGGELTGEIAAVVKDRLKKLDVLAFIERGDR
jgi:tetratricopeptide (TPR) repeat protein